MKTAQVLATVEVPGEAGSVTIARAYIRGILLAAGRPTVDHIELLIGELLTNSVQHSDSGRRPDGVVRLRVFDDGRTVHVDVTDQGSSASVPRIPPSTDLLSESGRGLRLVQELSSAWGWRADHSGRTVWFEVT
ncbi:ATP-binding protein [Sphaerisporangium aureirubrum]|uniref:ATP-binding protein n=1 Tax=Sphaerisporangium aureirubrum TaxID=1544736 RepID=A0ABW1NEX4_9ACTN